MRTTKRMLALLLCFAMVLSVFAMTVSAEKESPNVTIKTTATEVEVGQTFDVFLGIGAMNASSVAFGFDFDKTLVEVTAITAKAKATLSYTYEDDFEGTMTADAVATSVSTKAEANNSGHVGCVWAGDTEVPYAAKEKVVQIRFKALASGTVEFQMFEDSAGAEGHKGTWTSETTVVIKGSEPEPPAHVCTPGDVSYKKGENGKHIKVVACADNCGESYSSTEESCSGGTADCENAAVCEHCGNTYGSAKGHGNEGFRYTHVAGTDTHDVICVECEETVEKKVACTFEDGSHVCKFACGNETDCSDAAGDKDHDCDVCGKPGITECSGGTATCKDKAVCSECGKEYGDVDANAHIGEEKTEYTDNGANHTVKVYYAGCGHEISSKVADHEYGDGFACICGNKLAGWQQKDGAWYYVVDGKPVTGTVRVPYPTEAINGKTYGPNADDVAYSAANADSKYTDEKTAMFIFGADGKFQNNTTGIVDGNRYAVNGMIPWHYGLVEINGEYYYFVGDVNGGGNIAAEGDIYLSRINGIAGFAVKDVYNFAGGKLSGLNGLVDRYGDGKLFYYENSKLMLGNGLTKIGEGYVYVRSNGQIATGKYWVAKTNGICNPGLYNFGDDGFMQTAKDPTINGLVDGIYYKDGFPYYAGLIEIDGATYYINSAGEAVTGSYYITKLDNYKGTLKVERGAKLTFAADGKLVTE